MATTTALVIVIFGLLALNGAGLLVAFLVFRSVLERFDMLIQQKQITSSVDDEADETPRRKIFVRSPKSAATPKLVAAKPQEESDAADLVTHQDLTDDSRFKDLDQVDREVLDGAVAAYQGYIPEETEEVDTVEEAKA